MKEGRELSYKALLLMEGQEVVVHDCAYDIYDQICIVKLIHGRYLNKKLKIIDYVSGIILENEEYKFEYDFRGECINGEFRVRSCGEWEGSFQSSRDDGISVFLWREDF